MSTVLVTGCAGFIGSHLSNALLKKGYTVLGLDNLSNGTADNLPKSRRFKFYWGDARSCETLPNLIERSKVIYHLAALGSVPRSIAEPEKTHDNNVNGMFNVLNHMRFYGGNKRLVYASSSSVSVFPWSPYALSKHINEEHAINFRTNFGVDAIGLRYFNVFGPKQKSYSAYAAVIPKWTIAMLNNRPVILHGTDITRRFTPVRYAVDTTILAGEARNHERIVYDVSYIDNETKLIDLFDALKNLTGYTRLPLLDCSIKTPEKSPHPILTPETLGASIRMEPGNLMRNLKETVSYYRSAFQ